MKIKKKGFALLTVLLLVSSFSILSVALFSLFHNTNDAHFRAYKKIQASNYAVEGIELLQGYVRTERNKDQTNAWNNVISVLSGDYVIGFDDDSYVLKKEEKELIEIDEPYAIDYFRTITIMNGDSSDEKKIISSVDYGEGTIAYEYTIVNIQ